MKRTCDILFSCAGILLLLPLYAVIAFLIKREDGGPVLYNGIRTGLGGTKFRMHKFRTMVVNADRIGGASSANDDPRITRIGRKLRSCKLDELPQLFNVLKGEMSFVGPRPEVPFYTDMFTEEEKKILSVRPGITDWASLWNSNEGVILAGSIDPEKTYMEKIRPEKIRLQLQYVRERSLPVDFSIIISTIAKIIKK
ncbi:MAG TPA: sugar transferase [Candidatus Omnitrophota bacterium]|nr:sugar transferase [Candidatus Omnitrophota bacterium]HNQ50825.1 sugar transferase [Candidatus Omnitrophota bacterium]